MTKRIISLALTFVLIVSAFTACGKKNKPTSNPDTSNTSSTTAEAGASVPSIEDDTANAAETESTTANAGDKNTGKPSSVDKPESKPASTTKPSSSSAAKPASKPTSKPTTTKPASKPETMTKPSSSGTTKPNAPTSTQFSYFMASTGEKIRYTSYDVDYGKCTPSESNGVITFTYANGVTDTKIKCDNCGKYLCDGCQPIESAKCPKCGKTNCMTYSRDVTCYRCGKFVKANTCHPCNGGLPGFEGPYERG